MTTAAPPTTFGPSRVKDPVYLASGRLSHAVRVGANPDVIQELRRDLVIAQAAKYLAVRFEEVPPTKAQAKALCKLIMDSAAA